MKNLLNLLKSNIWLFLIYQIKFDLETGHIQFMKNNPLPNGMTSFFKRDDLSMSKEEKKLFQNFAQICKDYIRFVQIKSYLENTKDDKTEILKKLLFMTNKLYKKLDARDFFACFINHTQTDGQIALKFNAVMFNYFHDEHLREIVKAIELITNSTKAIEAWYERTSNIIHVFLPEGKVWFSEKDYALFYSKKKKQYLEEAAKERDKIVCYLEPPPPKTKDEPTE